jgi:hypothetical protein
MVGTAINDIFQVAHQNYESQVASIVEENRRLRDELAWYTAELQALTSRQYRYFGNRNDSRPGLSHRCHSCQCTCTAQPYII